MIQRLLSPLVCDFCGNEYFETGYWRDGQLCPACSASERRQEEERKKDIAGRAAAAMEKWGLELGDIPDGPPDEARKAPNPRNAGRKAVKWNAAYCELLVDRAAEGKSEAEFAAEIGVAQSLLQYWTEKHKNFQKAREIANEMREAWIEKNYRLGMLSRVPCQPSMMIRYAAAKLGWGEKSENVISAGRGEIPVVRIVERDTGFPAETLAPSAEQAAAAEAAG